MSEEDLYPSRIASFPVVQARRDPVVYGSGKPPRPLTPALVRSYEENGFVLLESLFGEGEIAALLAELERLRKDRQVLASEQAICEPGSNALRSVFQVHRQSQVFARLVRDDRLANVARYLLDDDVYIHQSRLNYKPGFAGKEFYWHSDFETWHVEDGMPRMRALSISIALTENTDANGPLMLIPGSHQTFVGCVGETPEDHYKQSLVRQEYGVPDPTSLENMADAGGIAAIKGPPGTVVVFDCNTMHGSNSNISPLPRSNAFLVYNAMANRLVDPFSGQKPRPEHIAARRTVAALGSVADAA